jgi:hypothetical protein
MLPDVPNVTTWTGRGVRTDNGGSMPADACPFPRPFPPDFDGCPAYQPRSFVALDLRYRPLPPVMICQHLEVSPTARTAHRYYGRCGIGDAAARALWVEQVRAQRVQKLRELGAEIVLQIEPLVTALWEAKGRQLEAQQGGRDAVSPTRGVREAAERIRGKIVAFLREHRTELEAAGLPYQACLEIVDAMLERFVTHPTTDVPVGVPAELLSQLPETVRIFFNPHLGQHPASDANSTATG